MEDTIKVLSGERLETTDMSIFKHLEANREVADKRCEKIEKSVEKIGWIIPEIIVNENMEVIDGQGRVEVAKRHGFPVRYQMIPGIGAEECISMNLDQTNWKMQDFCKSWEKRGNENYARLNSLADSFSSYSLSVIVCAITGLTSMPSKTIKEGRLLCSEEQLKVATKALKWLDRFSEVFSDMTNATGSRFQMALLFIYTMDGVDQGRVVKSVCSHTFSKNDSFSNIHTTLQAIERIYNNRLSPQKRVYFDTEYHRALSAKCGWYEAKWGWKIAEATEGRTI